MKDKRFKVPSFQSGFCHISGFQVRSESAYRLRACQPCKIAANCQLLATYVIKAFWFPSWHLSTFSLVHIPIRHHTNIQYKSSGVFVFLMLSQKGSPWSIARESSPSTCGMDRKSQPNAIINPTPSVSWASVPTHLPNELPLHVCGRYCRTACLKKI